MWATIWEFVRANDRLDLMLIVGVFIVAVSMSIVFLRGFSVSGAISIGLGVLLVAFPAVTSMKLPGGFSVETRDLAAGGSQLAHRNSVAIDELRSTVLEFKSALVKIDGMLKSKVPYSEITTFDPGSGQKTVIHPNTKSLEEEYARQLSTITSKISALESTLKQTSTIQDKVEKTLMELNSAVSR